MNFFKKSNFLHIAFFGLFFIAGFAKFESIYISDDIYYPFPVDVLTTYSREIAGLFILISFLLFSTHFFKFFESAPVVVLAGFNIFLSIKMLLQQNEYWYRNIFGIFVLYGLYFVSSIFFENRKFIQSFLPGVSIVSCAMIFVVVYMYIGGGLDSISWGSEYFFFSSHKNHAGAVWAMVSILLISAFLFGEARIKVFSGLLFLISFSLLVLTGSRGSLLSCLAGLVVIFRYSKFNFIGFAFSVLPVIFVCFAFFYDDVYEFYLMQIDRGNTRDIVYAVAIDDFLRNIFVGARIGEGRALYVENTILAFMQLGGLIGLSFVILFYLLCFRKLYIAAFVNVQSVGNVTMTALLVCALFASMFEAFPLNFISSGLLMFVIPLGFFRND